MFFIFQKVLYLTIGLLFKKPNFTLKWPVERPFESLRNSGKMKAVQKKPKCDANKHRHDFE